MTRSSFVSWKKKKERSSDSLKVITQIFRDGGRKQWYCFFSLEVQCFFLYYSMPKLIFQMEKWFGSFKNVKHVDINTKLSTYLNCLQFPKQVKWISVGTYSNKICSQVLGTKDLACSSDLQIKSYPSLIF